MHLFEDLVITEVVDEGNRPVPLGVYGEKVLVTVLFSRTLPLIRYELSDSVRPSISPYCPCGRLSPSSTGYRGASRTCCAFQLCLGAKYPFSRLCSTALWTPYPLAGGRWFRNPRDRPCC
jgi:phenylacetate-CoA ligase